MKYKRNIIITLIIIACCLMPVIIMVVRFFTTEGYRFDICIYETINELENLEKSVSENMVVERYDTPNKDKNIKKLQYKEFYGAKFSSSDLKFTIFAYEFEDNDTAKQYFNNVTHSNYHEEINFLLSGNNITRTLIVLHYNRAYYMEFLKKDEKKILSLLSENFSIKVVDDGTVLR